MTGLTVRIGAIVAPPGSGLVADDLRARVAAELADLLAREPLRTPLRGDAALEVPGGRIDVPARATAPVVANAIARHVHAALQAPERLP